MVTQDSNQVQALRQRYKTSLSAKSESISEYVKNISASTQPNTPILNALHADLHKLAGSSGMYGYIDIAQLTRAAMQDIAEQSDSALLQRMRDLGDLLEHHAKR
ncbi:MAG: phage-related minor tail protein [Cryomorphaceae bacterium]|jgi:phage-related minor tail protein